MRREAGRLLAVVAHRLEPVATKNAALEHAAGLPRFDWVSEVCELVESASDLGSSELTEGEHAVVPLGMPWCPGA